MFHSEEASVHLCLLLIYHPITVRQFNTARLFRSIGLDQIWLFILPDKYSSSFPLLLSILIHRILFHKSSSSQVTSRLPPSSNTSTNAVQVPPSRHRRTPSSLRRSCARTLGRCKQVGNLPNHDRNVRSFSLIRRKWTVFLTSLLTYRLQLGKCA